jgi:hypothetical protein
VGDVQGQDLRAYVAANSDGWLDAMSGQPLELAQAAWEIGRNLPQPLTQAQIWTFFTQIQPQARISGGTAFLRGWLRDWVQNLRAIYEVRGEARIFGEMVELASEVLMRGDHPVIGDLLAPFALPAVEGGALLMGLPAGTRQVNPPRGRGRGGGRRGRRARGGLGGGLVPRGWGVGGPPAPVLPPLVPRPPQDAVAIALVAPQQQQHQQSPEPQSPPPAPAPTPEAGGFDQLYQPGAGFPAAVKTEPPDSDADERGDDNKENSVVVGEGGGWEQTPLSRPRREGLRPRPSPYGRAEGRGV